MSQLEEQSLQSPGQAGEKGRSGLEQIADRHRQSVRVLKSETAEAKPLRVWPGQPYPLGATWDGKGVNFAIYSENATKVELCLFDAVDSVQETHRIELTERTHQIWHAYFPDLLPGQLYGYRVHGPYDPPKGHRFNPHKLLLDPYAKSIARRLRWDDSLFGYHIGDQAADLSFDERDSAPFAPLAEVIDTAFTWGDERRPSVPLHETIIYEMHIQGFTKQHPDIPEEVRGTFLGLASEPAIRHLTGLGITTVELLPVQLKLNDRHLVEKGLSNYWGYNTLNYFAPETSYQSSLPALGSVQEFKTMVRNLHAAGIEVILDVVYNHTCEGSAMGPTLSFRGVDNAAYYSLSSQDPRYYVDFSGCGNCLNLRNPFVLQMIMDSLRYWVIEMHVDGFRFDLASVLARELMQVDRLGTFFDIIHQDPILSQVKLIAEPWDLGEGGYQVGNFPVLWSEWNDRYRDCIRRFWKGDGGVIQEFATRLCGSSDLYEWSGRRPSASINFITAHDGFTLTDLVSYNEKHNEANGEDNRDGSNNNISWNCGAEGPTDDKAILDLRQRKIKNFLATLMFSQGVPMLFSGDEIGHSQSGNNNVYCQENELAWLDWNLLPQQERLLEFVRRIIRIRRDEPALHRRRFFHGKSMKGEDAADIAWINVDGSGMTDEAWQTSHTKCLGVLLFGDSIDINPQGEPITGRTLLILFNADHGDPIPFTLPTIDNGNTWECLLDTAALNERGENFDPGEAYLLQPASLVLFCQASPARENEG